MKARVAILGLAVSALAPIATHARGPVDAEFLPLAVGNKWSYVSSDGHESVETVNSVVDVRDAGGRVIAQAAGVAATDGGESYYVRTDKGIVRFYEPPTTARQEKVTWVLRFPLLHGARWESWTPAGLVEFRVTDRSSVTAPDGSLTDGIRVDFKSIPEAIFEGHIVYARGIGPVEIVEGDYKRNLLGYRAGDGPTVPVARKVAGLEPPDMAERWRVGRKGWFALVLMVATAAGVAMLPRLKRSSKPAASTEPVLVEEEGALPVQAARLEQSIALHPDYADLRCKLGAVYLAMSRHEDAVEQFRRALELNPHYVQAGLGLTRTLQAARRHREAVEAIRPFAEKHPGYADVQNLYGEALFSSGDVAAAEERFKKALEINPRYEQARRNLDNLGGVKASG